MRFINSYLRLEESLMLDIKRINIKLNRIIRLFMRDLICPVLICLNILKSKIYGSLIFFVLHFMLVLLFLDINLFGFLLYNLF